MLKKERIIQLRAQAHALKPVVLLGQHGYTPAVQAEINQALDTHELIKVKIPGDDRDYRAETIQQICADLSAERIQSIGKVVVLYRKRAESAK